MQTPDKAADHIMSRVILQLTQEKLADATDQQPMPQGSASVGEDTDKLSIRRWKEETRTGAQGLAGDI